MTPCLSRNFPRCRLYHCSDFSFYLPFLRVLYGLYSPISAITNCHVTCETVFIIYTLHKHHCRSLKSWEYADCRIIVNELSDTTHTDMIHQKPWSFQIRKAIDIAMSEFIYEKDNNINTMHILQISLQKIKNKLRQSCLIGLRHFTSKTEQLSVSYLRRWVSICTPQHKIRKYLITQNVPELHNTKTASHTTSNAHN